jgi:hypothetical protein
LESTEAKALKPFYNYKLSGIKEIKEQEYDVEREYRLGVNDPSRRATKIEE